MAESEEPSHEQLAQQLLALKKKTSWSWERMTREFARVMKASGPVPSTLFRCATERVTSHNPILERYIHDAIEKINQELAEERISTEDTSEDVDARIRQVIGNIQGRQL